MASQEVVGCSKLVSGALTSDRATLHTSDHSDNCDASDCGHPDFSDYDSSEGRNDRPRELACPFHKHDPQKYNRGDFEACASGFKSIWEVKYVTSALVDISSILTSLGTIFGGIIGFPNTVCDAGRNLGRKWL